MSFSPEPLDAGAGMRLQRWQERGARRDARGAMWRRTVLLVLSVLVGGWLLVEVRAWRADGPARAAADILSPRAPGSR